MTPSTTLSGRCHRFGPDQEPFRTRHDLELLHSPSGPLLLLNPTRAQYQHVNTGGEALGSTSQSQKLQHTLPPNHEVEFCWTSRNSRKGRHQLYVRPTDDAPSSKYLPPASTAAAREVLRNIGRMFTEFPYWDVSWVVAAGFTLGSVIWVFNAFFVWLPLQTPSTEFSNEILYAGGITAFIGATVFFVFSLFLMLEAINENRTDCFGWAVEHIYEDQKDRFRIHADTDVCKHHHQNRQNLVGKGSNTYSESHGEDTPNDSVGKEPHSGAPGTPPSSTWTWYPSWDKFRHHLIFEIGFLACSFQLAGATIFWISGFTALPGILNHLSQPLEDGIYWTPQVIGGSGFIISGFLFMLETQERWYLPALDVLGWHIGLWNFIGGLGFTLCPAFGYDAASWAQYEASLSTFWGSWAFLIGSLIQLYESVQKYPVKVLEKPKVHTGHPSSKISD